MTTAYIIAGSPSAGNRLVASVFARSGCLGEGSGIQPRKIEDIPKAEPNRPIVFIKHRRIDSWVDVCRVAGYSRVVVVVVVREPFANARSLVARGSVTKFDDALRFCSRTIAQNITAAVRSGADLEVITYEGLSENFFVAWLPYVGLPYVSGPLDLPEMDGLTSIENQNAKHYV